MRASPYACERVRHLICLLTLSAKPVITYLLTYLLQNLFPVYGYFTPPELRRPSAMQVHAVLRIALAVSFAALGAAEPYFNCPKGAYLSYKRRAIATLDLARCAKRTLPIRPQLVHPPAHHRRQQREAISAGWQPHGNKDPNYGHTYERTGTSTWCSSNSVQSRCLIVASNSMREKRFTYCPISSKQRPDASSVLKNEIRNGRR